VAILTFLIFLLLVVASVVTLVVATRSASEGFEDEVGFHRVQVPRSSRSDDTNKRD
jgi:hypothetical protein